MSGVNFERAKLNQGFLPANTRPSCRNCQHGSEQKQQGGWQCLKGGFFTTALAVCNEHQIKTKGTV